MPRTDRCAAAPEDDRIAVAGVEREIDGDHCRNEQGLCAQAAPEREQQQSRHRQPDHRAAGVDQRALATEIQQAALWPDGDLREHFPELIDSRPAHPGEALTVRFEHLEAAARPQLVIRRIGEAAERGDVVDDEQADGERSARYERGGDRGPRPCRDPGAANPEHEIRREQRPEQYRRVLRSDAESDEKAGRRGEGQPPAAEPPRSSPPPGRRESQTRRRAAPRRADG